jgi:hypothetical protein
LQQRRTTVLPGMRSLAGRCEWISREALRRVILVKA